MLCCVVCVILACDWLRLLLRRLGLGIGSDSSGFVAVCASAAISAFDFASACRRQVLAVRSLLVLGFCSADMVSTKESPNFN